MTVAEAIELVCEEARTAAHTKWACGYRSEADGLLEAIQIVRDMRG